MITLQKKLQVTLQKKKTFDRYLSKMAHGETRWERKLKSLKNSLRLIAREIDFVIIEIETGILGIEIVIF